MGLLKRIFDFYIFSNIHVAIAGFCMTKITLIKYGMSNNSSPFFVAFSIIISYNFIRYYEIKTNRLNWLKNWLFENKLRLLLVTIIAVLGLIYILFLTDFYLKSLLILLPFAFMTLFYVVPLGKIGKLEFSFRNFPSIKIFSIAIAWAGISVFFPLYEAKIDISLGVYLEFIQRFALLIAITIPFDIRDINSDSSLLQTLPQLLGIKATKIIGTYLLVFVLFLECFKEIAVFNEVLILIVILIITAFFLWFSSVKKSRYYTGFWVEAIPILWLLLIVLL